MDGKNGETRIKGRDIRTDLWDPIQWTRLKGLDAIQALFKKIDGDVSAAIDWYARSKRYKTWASQILRGLAIALGAIGGLAPLVAGIPQITDGSWGLNSALIGQCGYILIGIAAGLMAADRFFGVSTGWMRYMTTQMAIQHAQIDFRFDWARRLRALNDRPPDDDTVVKFLDRGRAFIQTINDMVKDETDAWVNEFRSGLSQLEATLAAQRKKAERAGEEVQRAEEREAARRRPDTPPRRTAKRARGPSRRLGPAGGATPPERSAPG